MAAVSNLFIDVILIGFTACMSAASSFSFAADPGSGREIYSNYCRGCHGEEGKGLVARAPDFTRGQGLMAPDSVLARGLRSGKGGMPAYEGILKDQQLLDVVAYLRTFQR